MPRHGSPELGIASLFVGGGRPFTLIAGPCAIESRDHARRHAAQIQEICASAGVPLIYKSSFDKANRSSLTSYRGPGIDAGLEILAEIRAELDLPVTTDLHLPEQAPAVAQAVDLLQIPAFLCRQTDLLVAAGRTGKPVNVKKGQFMAPKQMAYAVEKVLESGSSGAMLTERGHAFGYQDLVADMRGLAWMQALGVPVCMDATHAAQQPGALGGKTGGDRQVAELLARAGVAVGVDALFLEVHEDPDSAPSDGPNMIALSRLPALLATLVAIDRVVKES